MTNKYTSHSFRGRYYVTMDQKGRIHVPLGWPLTKVFQMQAHEMADSSVPCVLVYAKGEPPRETLHHELVNPNESISSPVDRKRRVVIPSDLRHELGWIPGSEIVLHGLGLYFAIWAKEPFETWIDVEVSSLLNLDYIDHFIRT